MKPTSLPKKPVEADKTPAAGKGELMKTAIQKRENAIMNGKKEEAEIAAARAKAQADLHKIDLKFIAKHKLTADETLSHLSLKYYGSATREYWMIIYNANKAVIGDNPAHVHPGMELNIPELPADMKKK